MRLLVGLTILIAVALVAWSFLPGAPRDQGDAVPRALPVAPSHEASRAGEGPREVPGAPAAATEVDDASREAAATERDEESRTAVASRAAEAAAIPELSPVRGLLRSESGGWRDLDGTVAGGVVVELFDPANPGLSRQARLSPFEEPDGSIALSFSFSVPDGTYLLRVSSLVAEVWEPREQSVTTPAEDVEIWCRDRIERVRLVFEATDADSGEPIEDFEVMSLRQTVSQPEGVFFHGGNLPREAFPIDGRVDWSLYAAGYAPAFGDETSFVPDGAGAWIARVSLRPGWGARVVVLARDPSMRPIDGALVEVDGVFAGLTGPRGWLDVERPSVPECISVRWNERTRVLDAPRDTASNEARRRGQLLLVVLE